ncbi:MAG TPA: FMN-binding protein [Humibacillus sp.]|nr:FMN-binding protein [Humibacillus sp.]
MRRIVTWAMSTLTVIVLLFSYHTSRSSVVATSETRPVTTTSSQSTTTDSGSGSSGGTGGTGGTGGSSSSSSSSSGSSADTTTSDSSSSSASKTYAGDAIDTRYGPVQVQITVASGKITAVDVLQVPMSDRHDQMINSQAVPIYNDEALQAQSASIDVVSGATYTWEGYTQSLQSAIDQANL